MGENEGGSYLARDYDDRSRYQCEDYSQSELAELVTML